MRLGQGQAGVIDAPLPPALAPTPFDRLGETIFALMMLFSAATAGLVFFRRLKDAERR
jgi:apolipoprotein N-acyltransferase